MEVFEKERRNPPVTRAAASKFRLGLQMFDETFRGGVVIDDRNIFLLETMQYSDVQFERNTIQPQIARIQRVQIKSAG